ncbi:hypothetical protein D3C86_1610790 [compost metagenome]
MQPGQTQLGLDLVGDFQTEIDGITAGFIGSLDAKRCNVRQVTEGEGIARPHAFKRIGVSQYRYQREQANEQQVVGFGQFHVHILVPRIQRFVQS